MGRTSLFRAARRPRSAAAADPVFGVVLGATLLGAVILVRAPSTRMEGLGEHV